MEVYRGAHACPAGHGGSCRRGSRRLQLVRLRDLIVALPRDITLDILGIDGLWSGRQAVVRFHPDGASTGAVLKLSREKAEYEIRVNWYTGGIAIGP